MKGNRKKSLTALLTLSIVSTILGILFSIFACHGECGSDVHGGMWTWVCPRFYVPLPVCILLINIGAIGVFVAVMLFQRRNKTPKIPFDTV